MSADPAGFVRGLAGALAEGGLLVLSTPNRTALSRLALIGIGERLGGIPRGTHDWQRFLTPDGTDRACRGGGAQGDRYARAGVLGGQGLRAERRYRARLFPDGGASLNPLL